MFGEYWFPGREIIVEGAEYAIAKEAILNNWNVIVDDTNLNPKYINAWKQIASLYNCDIEFKEFKVSLDEAIDRDKHRDHPVGEDIIRTFYSKYYYEHI